MDDIVIFLGRFHPLIVHLPIGIIIMAAILQFIALKSTKFKESLDPAISITLFWGGISSIGAVSAGWLLSWQGGYNADTLFWHKWLGISVTLISFIGWLMKSGRLRLHKRYTNILFTLIIILITVTGHLGGNLTHGSDYLFVYSPKMIKKIVGMEEGQKSQKLQELHPDSIKVYRDVIQPILDAKCISCHNKNKNNGGLILTSHRDLMKGGDNGTIVDVKSPLKSELFNRVTLPRHHKKFMPPKGTPLTFGEIQIFEWWMKTGTDSNSKFSSENELDQELIHMLLRDYNLDYSPRPFYEKVRVDSIPISAVTELRNNQFMLEFMGEHSNMLSIDYKGNSISKNQLDKLLLAKEQITWLNLGNCNLTDTISGVLPKLPNLTRLNLHSNPIGDVGIAKLTALKNLEVLNLYGTEITDNSFESIKQLPALKRLYLWRTPVTSEGVDKLNGELPGLKIITGTNKKSANE